MAGSTKNIGVYFDMMDTLIPDPFPAAACALAGTMREFVSLIRPTNYITFELGNISEQEYLDLFFLNMEKEKLAGFSALDFKEQLLKTPAIPQKRLSMLQAISSNHFTALASNYSVWAEHHIKESGIRTFLHEEFISYKMRIRKPDSGFYQMLKENKNFERYIFIDDRPENCDAARDHGFETVLAQGPWESELLNMLGLSS